MQLPECEILKGFTDDQLRRLIDFLRIESYEKDVSILTEGKLAEDFYIILSGKVAIVKNEVKLSEMGEGKHFGLMALIDGSSRSADVIAAEKTKLAVIPYQFIKDPNNDDIYQKIINNQLRDKQHQLRLMNYLTVTEEAKSKYQESLLKEIHHRVKNNLQMVSSMLYLQSKSIKDPDAKMAIKSSQQRVESMALLHKNLYQRENLADIEMKSYIQQLTNNLSDIYHNPSIQSGPNIIIDMDNVEINVEKAVPVGLIINELIINALKYAFPNQNDGKINISLSQKNKEKFLLSIKDNGIGKQGESTGFGSQLITLLTKQIGGILSESNEDGYECEIVF